MGRARGERAGRERRYLGKHRGIVRNVDDPERRGRLQVEVPGVLGEELSAWALPCLPFGGATDVGMFALPPVDATVWVEFEGGDPDRPIWVGAFWDSAPDGGDGDLGSTATTTVRTGGGQVLRLDDAEGGTGVTLRHSSGATIAIDDDGAVSLTDAGGSTVRTSPTGVEVTAGVDVTISAAATVTVAASVIELDGGIVRLGGGATTPLLTAAFLEGYLAHTHGTDAGGSGPPTTSTEPAAVTPTVFG